MTSRLGIAIVLGVLAGCVGPSDGAGGDQRARVVVYSAQDREFGEPVLRAYGQRTGVEVLTKFDVESSKTVGLATPSSRRRRDRVATCSGTTRSSTSSGSMSRPVPDRPAHDIQG
jgi:hypothetical protein